MKSHNYTTTIQWTGNKGEGTTSYTAYERSHTLSIAGKPDILCSSDTPFRGEASKHNPEDMLLASLSSCHMLWYLHLAADAGIVVMDYVDNATGTLVLPPDGFGHFSEVTLHPIVTITDESRIADANALHHKANQKCFIANSVNFAVKHEPACKVAETV
jgi:organic hydroperoxide reductase OsmC/OhrA